MLVASFCASLQIMQRFCARTLQATAWPEVLTQTWKEPCYVDILFTGYPCVDLSGLNTNPGAFMDTSRQTGMGYQATMEYVSRYRPTMVAIENVAQIACTRAADKKAGVHCRPIDVQNNKMADEGYDYAWDILDARKHSLPQTRRRAWMFYVRRGCGSTRKLVQTIREFETEPWPLSDILDFAISGNVGTKSHVAKISKKAKPKWREHVKTCVTRHNFSAKQVRDIVDALAPLPLTEREATCIALNQLKLTARGVDVSTKPIVIQVDQSIERSNVRAQRSLCPCVTPHGKFYVTDRKCILSSVAHLALQGIGPVETARYKVHEVLSERQAKNMAGNAFAATVCAASLLSFLSVWQRH